MLLSKNFDSSEFLCRCGCLSGTPSPALVDALQALREVAGRPIIVLSGCRCQAHNQAVGGAPSSRHLTGEAADIRCPGVTPRELYVHAAALCRFGGFGVDDAGGFLHVDVRPGLARWCYSSGKQTRWFEVV